MRQQQLLTYLKGACLGRARAARSAELEQTLRLGGTDLRKLVNRLRRSGFPVCSGPEGCFYAKNAGEILRTIRMLQGMIRGLEEDIRGLETALERFQEADNGGPTASREGV